jgi:hypothetical protein
MTIARVAILGDVLRPHPAAAARSEAVTRTRWLHDLLSPPLSRATGLPIGCVTADGAPLSYARLYEAAGLEPSADAWASLYASELLPDALSDQILEACRDALVIGMELPPSIRGILARAGVPALDCFVHPWRFLLDIPLAWRSTIETVGDALTACAVDPFDVERHAAAIRAKMRWLGTPPLAPGTTLVLDQLPDDAAMIDPRRGRRAGWSDYHETLRNLQAAGPVIWRPHPYAGHQSALAEYFGAESMTDANFYALLCSDGLETVVAISSGGVVEARAFGKRGVQLLDRDSDRDRAGWTPPVPVLGQWLSPHFWSAVLESVIPTVRDVPIVIPEPHAFRRANNTDWDYGWIDQVVVRHTSPGARERETSRRLDTVRDRAEVIAAAVHTLDERTTHFARQVDALAHQLADVQTRLGRLTAADLARVRATVQQLLTTARERDWRIGVLGAGGHTRWLLEETALAEAPGLRIFDRDPAAVDHRCGAHAVEPSTAVVSPDLDAVLVSSLSFEDEMVDHLLALGMPSDRIFRCYR